MICPNCDKEIKRLAPAGLRATIGLVALFALVGLPSYIFTHSFFIQQQDMLIAWISGMIVFFIIVIPLGVIMVAAQKSVPPKCPKCHVRVTLEEVLVYTRHKTAVEATD